MDRQKSKIVTKQGYPSGGSVWKWLKVGGPKTAILSAIILSIGALLWAVGDPPKTAKAGQDKVDKDKEAALTSLYANDLGPDKIDVSKYPAAMQKIYAGAFQKCARCHSLARSLNSQFLELTKEEIEKLKAANSETMKDSFVLQVEEGIWKRYVKRMMAKPGCDIKADEGKAIWEFMVYDSKQRKTGTNLKSWLEHRKKLLEEFKAKHPERYRELYGKK